MKTLLLITYVDFWRNGSGHRARISSIVRYLKKKVNITVYFAGSENSTDKTIFDNDFPEVCFEFSGFGIALTYQEFALKFRDYIKGKFFNVALVEYLELSAVLQYLSEDTITMLDTHDIIFKRIKTFNKFKLDYTGIVLNKQEELDIYRCYDYTILIQKKEYEFVSRHISKSRLLLVPHAVRLKKTRIRRKVSNIGYIASPYSPNIDALEWFIRTIWHRVPIKYNLTLNVYGNINNSMQDINDSAKSKNIVYYGCVEDLEKVYDKMDVMINPVRCGAGLKIKNIEALGHGLPLITSTHGASGIEDAMNNAYLKADTISAYLMAFDSLVGNYNFRNSLSVRAHRYAKSRFSEQKCYSSLLKIINS